MLYYVYCVSYCVSASQSSRIVVHRISDLKIQVDNGSRTLRAVTTEPGSGTFTLRAPQMSTGKEKLPPEGYLILLRCIKKQPYKLWTL